jgi:hypothetical protein
MFPQHQIVDKIEKDSAKIEIGYEQAEQAAPNICAAPIVGLLQPASAA